jgi:hypothetical protein
MRNGGARVGLLILVVVCLVSAQTADKPAAGLHCELQLNSEVLTTHPQSHLHFLLFSEQDGLKVYEDWNMWGYFARTFDLTVSENRNYQVTRRERGWDKNYPKAVTINRGRVLVTDIYLCDGTWRVSPKLPVQEVSVRMAGRYTLRPRTGVSAAPSFYPLEDVWVGTINSAPVELYLSNECVLQLNSDRP